jgi:hypothetical protein
LNKSSINYYESRTLPFILLNSVLVLVLILLELPIQIANDDQIRVFGSHQLVVAAATRLKAFRFASELVDDTPFTDKN